MSSTKVQHQAAEVHLAMRAAAAAARVVGAAVVSVVEPLGVEKCAADRLHVEAITRHAQACAGPPHALPKSRGSMALAEHSVEVHNAVQSLR